VTAGTVTVGEGNVLSGVNGNAVVLVANNGTGDVDVLSIADIEAIGVVPALGVASLRVEGYIDAS
jgi:hypothetical protein